MKSKLALALGLGLAFCAPAMADPYVNPGDAWWRSFFGAVNGVAPDFAKAAKSDPEYLAADEFTRADVLARIVERLKAEQAQFDIDGTEVTMAIRAQLGDYSADQIGFPVSLFTQNSFMQLSGGNLFFRNWRDFNIYAATPEEGRALRSRIGLRALSAEVTVGSITKSTTRPNAFEADVIRVAYYAADGLLVGEFTAPDAVEIGAAETLAKLDVLRQKIMVAASIPPLDTPWEEAKVMLAQHYPFVASDQFAYSDRGKTLAYVYENGGVVTDEAHAVDKTFLIYLQQVDGAWRTRPGFSFDASFDAVNAIETTGTGPGLACYTPEVLDRCAVLEFSPVEGGHALTRAYGVLELERSGSVEEVFGTFVGDAVDIFDAYSTVVAYDPASLEAAATPKFHKQSGTRAFAGGAGATTEGIPLYDPLKYTTGMNAINRSVAIFAVDGAKTRVPVIFVLQ